MTSTAARYLLSVLVYTRLCLFANELVVWEGHSVNLSCGSRDCSKEDVVWRKKNITIVKRPIRGETVVKLDKVEVYKNGTLHIHNVTFPDEDDEYNYRCGVHEGGVRLVVYQKVKKVTLTGPEFPRSENTTANFTCKAEGGNPVPYITWHMPPRSAETWPRKERGRLSKKSLILRSFMDRQVIGCSATQHNGTLTDSLSLNITYEPRITLLTLPGNYALGDRVELVCLATGNPAPVVSWKIVVGNDSLAAVNDSILTINSLNQAHKDTYRFICRAENSEGFAESELILDPQTDLALLMNLSLVAVSAAGLLTIVVFVLGYVCGRIRLRVNRSFSALVDNGSSGTEELELNDGLSDAVDYDPEMYLHPTGRPATAGDDSSTEPADRGDLDSMGYHRPTSLSTLASSVENFFPVANARNVVPRMVAEENVYVSEMYLHPTQSPRGEIDNDDDDNQTASATPTTTLISQMPRVAADRNVYYTFDEFQGQLSG